MGDDMTYSALAAAVAAATGGPAPTRAQVAQARARGYLAPAPRAVTRALVLYAREHVAQVAAYMRDLAALARPGRAGRRPRATS